MTVADGRYAAEAITRTAKIHVFDDIACLTAWLAENGGVMASLWVADFAAPDQWLAADSAVYLQNDTVHTPMASGLAALRPGREADSVQALLGRRLRSWPEVLAMPHGHAPGLAR
jgi:copper chaperone NosL